LNKIQKLLRKNIRDLKPYSSARNGFSGKADIFLDANENPFNTGLNRYPDPTQKMLKNVIAVEKGILSENILLGNGSDEVLDIIYRVFCDPRKDNIVTHSPSYGMYSVSAKIHDVDFRTGIMTNEFHLDSLTLEEKIDVNTKMLIFCSPNNPSGNNLNPDLIEYFLKTFSGIVLIDEAYNDYSIEPSWILRIKEFPQLIVMQTLSKAWGAAGIRLGMAFASAEVTKILHSIKPPYNINILTAKKAISIIEDKISFENKIDIVLREKEQMTSDLNKLEIVKRVFPSDANFLLVRFNGALQIYNYLVTNGVIIRDRTKEPLCHDCLRITIGRPKENARLLTLLKQYNIK